MDSLHFNYQFSTFYYAHNNILAYRTNIFLTCWYIVVLPWRKSVPGTWLSMRKNWFNFILLPTDLLWYLFVTLSIFLPLINFFFLQFQVPVILWCLQPTFLSFQPQLLKNLSALHLQVNRFKMSSNHSLIFWLPS